MLLDTPERKLGVHDGDRCLGVITTDSMLEALSRLIVARDDSSTIVAECHTSHYSASEIARAVEDADAHLVDLLTSPSSHGHILITLRINHADPSAAIRSLERYGYTTLEAQSAHGAPTNAGALAAERIASLNMLLNV